MYDLTSVPEPVAALLREYGDGLPIAYTERVAAARDLAALRAAIAAFAPLVPDAQAVVDAMTEADFPDWWQGRRLEQHGRYAGDVWNDRYSAVTMPLALMATSLVMEQFKAPWAVALCQLLKVGKLRYRNNGVELAAKV